MKKFKYQKRSPEQVLDRANQSAGQYDRLLKEGVKVFSPKADTKYRIRILPPTWDEATHFGKDVYVVYGVGSDNNQYLSLARMLGKECPLEQEQRRCEQQGDEEAAKALWPRKRVAIYLIDRANEAEGPQVWLSPYTFDKELSAQLIDDETGQVLDVDDPDNGYDVVFSREGSGMKTKYVGISVSRRKSPLSSDHKTADKWMDVAMKTPLPDALQYYSYEHIKQVLHGASAADAADATDKSRDEDDLDVGGKGKGKGKKGKKDKDARSRLKEMAKKRKGEKDEVDFSEDIPY